MVRIDESAFSRTDVNARPLLARVDRIKLATPPVPFREDAWSLFGLSAVRPPRCPC